MRVLAVVPSLYDTSPRQRFGIEQWEPILRGGGVEIEYAPFETDELRRVLYGRGNTLAKIGAVTRNLGRRRGELANLDGFDLFYIFREAALLGAPVVRTPNRPLWSARRIDSVLRGYRPF